MRTASCLALLLVTAPCLAAEKNRAIIGTVIEYEAPSGDSPGRMVVRHTHRVNGALRKDDYHFVFANHLLQGRYDPVGLKAFKKGQFKRQYPHFPKDVRKGVTIDVYTDMKPANGKVWTARGLLVDPVGHQQRLDAEEAARAKKKP
jgi:hypothetical protein